ncbi:hypothetical protein SDC9_119357 [bioreactor metagenome]|uniref:Uncharacterized protein n=1 Tax=bioreactor metagenome TaxID=1076179 RepID=A0A645C8N4_9ZZZZ
MGQASRDASNEQHREVYQLLGNPTIIHDDPREHEKRNGDERETVQTGNHFLSGSENSNFKRDNQQQCGDRGDRDTDRDRHPHYQQYYKNKE